MGLGGRGAFRRETRATRMERLHGPKVARTGTGAGLSEHEKEKRRAEALDERERYRQERFSKGGSSSD